MADSGRRNEAMNVCSSRFATIVAGFLLLCQPKGGFGEHSESESSQDVRRQRAGHVDDPAKNAKALNDMLSFHHASSY
jgi:hypothetical protein